MTDRQDEELEKKTTQEAPEPSIVDDSDLEDALDAIDGLHTELLGLVDDKDWIAALEKADELQETVNNIHAYIAGKIE